MKITLEIPEVLAAKLRELSAEWIHPLSDGTETEALFLLEQSICKAHLDLQERKARRVGSLAQPLTHLSLTDPCTI